MKVFTLKKRKDFLEAAKGFKVVTNGLVLQAASPLSALNSDFCYVGYTVTKKIGKAHVRNFTKRRLRAAAQIVFSEHAMPQVNYVLIGRHNTSNLDFKYLIKKMKNAVIDINRQIESQEKQNDKKFDDFID